MTDCRLTGDDRKVQRRPDPDNGPTEGPTTAANPLVVSLETTNRLDADWQYANHQLTLMITNLSGLKCPLRILWPL